MRCLLLPLALAACTTSGSDRPFPDDTAIVNLTMIGGLAPSPSPGSGSTCGPIDDEFTYSVAEHRLGWKTCQSVSYGVYHFATGEVTLSDQDHDTLLAALRALEPPATRCGGDILETFQFAALTGTATYAQGGCMPGASDVVELLREDAGI